MKHRFVVVVVLIFAAAALAPAQPSGVYSKAAPPDKAVLDRLNLKTEWSQYLPVEGTRDTLTQIQTIDDQVFVQTRTGFFVALDALTGRIQWVAKLGNGGYANSYPVAANSQFVFVAHVTKLYAFYRYTGTTEFVAEMGTPPTTGLACDDTGVYCVLGMRPGHAGAHRVAVFDLPRPITVNEPVKVATDPLAQGARAKATSPTDELLKRYNTGTIKPAMEVLEAPSVPKALEAPIGGATGSRTPSLTSLHSVVPPYTLGNRTQSPSLSVIPSLRPPYHVRSESSKYVQNTASLGVIPPSVAASLALADLRPKGVEPPLRWEYGLSTRILYPVHLTPTRAWVVTEGEVVIAFNKNTHAGKAVTEVKERLTSPIPASPVASGLTHYVPLGNGTLVAVNATGGNLDGGLNIKWRAVPGGINNRSPHVAKGFIYTSGDDSGVTCVNRDNGDVLWHSDDNIDRIIGANEEFVYLRDRQGRFLVFDARRPTDAARKRSAPLGSANLSEFNVNVVNTVSDRVYLAADNGLIVCLRDSSPKYAKPMRMWPPAEVNPPKKLAVDAIPAKDKDGMSIEPKKEP
jgi:outer membrane protein assembly factor BamB